MGDITQYEWWEKHPNRYSFGWLWLRKLRKVMAKALERQSAILAHLFMKLMEIRRKERWKVIGCMWGGKWRKIMEIEENRGLIDKKASKDQSTTYFQFSFGALSLFYLSLSLTLGHLEFLGRLWHWSKKGKEVKRKQRSSRERQDQAATKFFIAGIKLHVYFPC